MKKISLIAFIAVTSFAAFSQNGDPYSQFGHTSKVKYQSTVSELLYINNPDTTAIAKAIAFDIENGFVFFLGSEDTIIERLKVSPEKILRFISSDPLTSKEPGWSPYRAFYNNPLRYTDPTGLLEFDTYKGYKKYAKEHKLEVLGRKEIGAQGHWLAADREDNTAVWGTANQYNLKQEAGYNQYSNIVQRAAFYDWFQGAAEKKGHEIKWAGAAAEIAFNIDKLTWSLPKMLGYSNDELANFAEEGNARIFKDVFNKLNVLYNNSPQKGADALRWDNITLSQEQHLIQPLYGGLSAPSAGLLSALVKQRLVFSGMAPVPPFPSGNSVLNVSQRWEYGMRAMGHNVTAGQMLSPGIKYE